MNVDLVREFIELEVKEALNQMTPLKALGPDGILPKPINHTLITLVLKVANPELVSEFRPISLCNVLSRIYSKVKWVYFERLMERMGFCSRWITLMLSCVRTVTYSIMVNGEPIGMIHPKRDDSLLFCRSIFEDCNNVLKLLAEFEFLSGQKINKDKTATFFSKSTTDEAKTSIKNLFQIQEVKSYEKYLGLPSFVGRGKKASFNYIKERVWIKLQAWEGKLLSQAGREVHIKS
ncbi:uncharacterized protein LOC142620558 [Castanea sativa]|uniref:uncharacterized protein LOC142620558 n=1 Tax=Castanea sativa TaxID=21020 RepID=UPI003F649BE5